LPNPTPTAAPIIPNRRLYSPAETQELLGVSHATLYRLIKAGKLAKVKMLGRTGITADSIDRLCAGEAE
jgi:excisionase family DNA binding protein